MTAFSKQTINHDKSLFQPSLDPFSLLLISKLLCLSCGGIILKLENAATFFSLQYLYNMQKTSFSGGYVICNIKATIFVCCTMINDKKKMSVQRIEALEALDDNILFVPFHISYPQNFCFSLFIISSTWILWFLLGCKYVEFILIFGLLNIVTTFHNERESLNLHKLR